MTLQLILDLFGVLIAILLVGAIITVLMLVAKFILEFWLGR